MTEFIASSPQITGAAVVVEFARANGETGRIEGYGTVYDGKPDSSDRIMTRGMFSASLAAHRAAGTMPVMLWSHDPSRPVGSWKRVVEDSRGLHVAGQMNRETVGGREALAHIVAKDVTGLSVGWNSDRRDIKFSAGGVATFARGDLHEISIVAIPAKNSARILQVASVASQRGFERMLHEAGFPRAAAARLAAGGWPALANSPTEHDQKQQIASLIDRINAATCALQNKGT